MCWNSDTEIEEYAARGRAWLDAPESERQKMTFEEAREYILPDTLAFAGWEGICHWAKRDQKTACEALTRYFEKEPWRAAPTVQAGQ